MASVKLEKVWKRFGDLGVVRNVDLLIEDGKVVTLVGPSGCGKSTLLRMIAGLETISSGKIHIGDRLVNRVPPKARNVAMVFQNYALYPHMTVAQNMGFSLKLAGVAPAEIAERVKQVAGILGLEAFLSRHPRQLSGGQRQRVAMGRAIVRNPQVFLFDEPLSNLDAKLRATTRGEIKALHQRLGTTTIFVTHDQVEAMTLSDVVVVMNNGEIEQIGAPLEVYNKPANTFVADFIGSPSMNLIHGELDGRVFRAEGGLEIPLPSRPEGVHHADVVLGIRPEHLALTTAADADAFAVTVSLVEPTGADTILVGSAGGREIVCEIPSTDLPDVGECIYLAPRPGSAHFFDPGSGKRMLAA